MSTDSNGLFEEAISGRPLRDLLLLMPLLPVGDRADIDYNAADPALLKQIAANADLSAEMCPQVRRGRKVISVCVSF